MRKTFAILSTLAVFTFASQSSAGVILAPAAASTAGVLPLVIAVIIIAAIMATNKANKK